jgi:hypothetical protein
MLLIEEKGAGAGVTGAKKAVVRLGDTGEETVLKLKNFPPALDFPNNSPRREIAAYALQHLFLDPVDYVVPTSGVRCVPFETWKKHNTGSRPHVRGTQCALISYSAWLQNVTLPDPLYDPERYATDGRYAYYLGNFNILTYLVRHHDTRRGNVLVSKNDDDRRVFAIDNGTTFGAFFYNWFYPPTFAWRNIMLTALPRVSINRLRELKEEDLDVLLVVVQMESDDAGILHIVKPGPSIDDDDGVSVSGTTLQLGLTDDEVEGVWERIEDLLEDIDDGEIGTF